MKKALRNTFALFVVAAILGLSFREVNAAASDYRFELVRPPVMNGTISTVTVRLIHIPDNKPVSEAVVLETRADMGPSGMAGMTAPVKVVSGNEPGIYAFEVTPGMAGAWGLTIAAKVQGEADTVRGTVTVDLGK